MVGVELVNNGDRRLKINFRGLKINNRRLKFFFLVTYLVWFYQMSVSTGFE